MVIRYCPICLRKHSIFTRWTAAYIVCQKVEKNRNTRKCKMKKYSMPWKELKKECLSYACVPKSQSYTLAILYNFPVPLLRTQTNPIKIAHTHSNKTLTTTYENRHDALSMIFCFVHMLFYKYKYNNNFHSIQQNPKTKDKQLTIYKNQ